MTLFAEILSKFSNAELSVALGIDESHARVMKVRALIPIKHWDAIIAAAPAKGLDVSNDKLLQARKLRAAEMDARRAERRAA